MKQKRYDISGIRVVFMHARFWEAAKLSQSSALKKRGREAEYDFMHALVDAAFALEAYVQYLGAKYCSNWQDVERKSYRQRVEAVAKSLGIDIDFGLPPYSDIRDLIKARNSIAHARPQYNSIEISASDCINTALIDDTGAQIEMLCTGPTVTRMLDAIEQGIELLHEASDEPLHPLYVQGVTTAVSREIVSE